MALRFNDVLFRRDIAGMPDSHAEKFRTVAATQKCVILCRAVGPTCRQLLEQGYDTKGFRIHGKSCDWGPMAGFVLRDPRLNKYGMDKAEYNRKEHAEALSDAKAGAGWVAATTPLKIYRERIDWLIEKNLIHVDLHGERFEGRASHRSGINFFYNLIPDSHLPDVYGVYLDNVKNGRAFKQERGNIVVRYDTKYGNMVEPLLAMTNSLQHCSWPAGDFRNAITGDYDLFAIWPYAEEYRHEEDDRRVLGTAKAWSQREHIESHLERFFTVGGQGTKMGNITNRIYEVAQYLNSLVGGAVSGGWGPFPKRMVCWHSDEAARPFVNEVDLPLIAFAPSQLEVGIETIVDFERFVRNCLDERIHVTMAEGWVLPPQPGKPHRLGPEFAHLVPNWDQRGQPGMPRLIPDWYNR